MPDWTVEFHPACDRWAERLDQPHADADDRFDGHQAALTAKRTKKNSSSNRSSKSNRKTKGKKR